jgi:hypothetical protein
MRYLTAACPDMGRIILVESGSRRALEGAITGLRRTLGDRTAFDLVTCYPGSPAGLDSAASIWRTQDHGTTEARARMLNELTATGAKVVAIICSGEPIMTRWKWWLAWKLPAKVLIINENSDAFWLDTAHLRLIRQFVLARAGLTGEIAGGTVARVLMLPLVFVYLLLWASIVHMRRLARLAFLSRNL